MNVYIRRITMKRKLIQSLLEILLIMFACMLMTWVSIHYSAELSVIRNAILDACTPSRPCVRIIVEDESK